MQVTVEQFLLIAGLISASFSLIMALFVIPLAIKHRIPRYIDNGIAIIRKRLGDGEFDDIISQGIDLTTSAAIEKGMAVLQGHKGQLAKGINQGIRDQATAELPFLSLLPKKYQTNPLAMFIAGKAQQLIVGGAQAPPGQPNKPINGGSQW